MTEQRSLWLGLRRGVGGRCPSCGQGALFSSYLKLNVHCAQCRHILGQYRADDGPAYFTILIIGHLLIAPLLFAEFLRTWPLLWALVLVIGFVVGLALWLLPRVKGAFVGVLWAVGDSPTM